MEIKSKKTALVLTAILAISMLSAVFLISSSPSSGGGVPPTTVIDQESTVATRYETQRKVFQNPRGQNYYYALTYYKNTTFYQLRMYKSSNGTYWDTFPGGVIYSFSGDTFESADLAFFEDNANERLVVYLVWTNTSKTAFYRATWIFDNSSDLYSTTYHEVPYNGQMFDIEVDREKYVWLLYRDTAGTGLRCLASNSTEPGLQSPYNITWSSEKIIGSSPNAIYGAIAPLSSGPNVLIAHGSIYTGPIPKFYGVEMYWTPPNNFTTGTTDWEADDWIESYPMISLVVDSSNAGDVVYLQGYSTWSVKFRKWTVGSGWSSYGTVYSGSVTSLSLSIDKNLNKLYAFYIRQNGKVNYKTSSASAISWSSEMELADDSESLDHLSTSSQDTSGRIQIVYTTQTTAKVRFAELTGTVTIATSTSQYATRYETQRKVFQNPWGEKRYYALAFNGSDLNLWNSTDGNSWNLETVINSSFTNYESADMVFYHNGTSNELVVYFVYSDTDGKVYYRRGVVSDSSSSMTLDSNPQVVFSSTHHKPVTKIANDGYLWIASSNVTPLESYTLYNVTCIASTTTYPSASPTWSSEYVAFWNFQSEIYFTMANLSSTHDIIIAGQTYAYGHGSILKGKELSWNGTAFSEGKKQDMDIGAIASEPLLSVVVDSSNYGHVLYISGDNEVASRVEYRNWTVGTGFSSNVTVYSGSVDSLSLSIAKNSDPDTLYAFYVRQNGVINYKTSSVSTINWSSEKEITDGNEDLDYLSSSYQDWNSNGKIQIIYTTQTTYQINFVEIG